MADTHPFGSSHNANSLHRAIERVVSKTFGTVPLAHCLVGESARVARRRLVAAVAAAAGTNKPTSRPADQPTNQHGLLCYRTKLAVPSPFLCAAAAAILPLLHYTTTAAANGKALPEVCSVSFLLATSKPTVDFIFGRVCVCEIVFGLDTLDTRY